MSQPEAFLSGDLELAVQTPHYHYSPVFIETCAPTHLAVIGSDGPIRFAEMAQYFTQADSFEAFLESTGLERVGSPLTWFYHNEETQPPDPGGNPVREPFTFEVGYEVRAPARPVTASSDSAGRYYTRPLRDLRVASVFYRGSFPHQPHSGFAEAWMSLVREADRRGYALRQTLYREIYHHLDETDPQASVTEIQVEIA